MTERNSDELTEVQAFSTGRLTDDTAGLPT
jgi:hypothetical protein